MQDNCPTISNLKDKIRNNEQHLITNAYKRFVPFLKINENDLLVFSMNKRNRIVIPQSHINDIIHDFHCIPIAGHFGITKTCN
jgi:hypothetical protein